MTENERDEALVAQGMLTRREASLPQWQKRTLVDLRRRVAELENQSHLANVGAEDSPYLLRFGMESRVVGDRYTSLAVVQDDPGRFGHEYLDFELCRAPGAQQGWVRIMGSRPFDLRPFSSNVIYAKVR